MRTVPSASGLLFLVRLVCLGEKRDATLALPDAPGVLCQLYLLSLGEVVL